jgi:UDP-N-acetylglucosamine 2-epimerase (non-hydrolysing)
MKKKILFIFGTRPEAIKLAPVILAFKNQSETFETRVCVTAQHREMLDQVLSFFRIVPDVDLDIMKPGQTLADVTVTGLSQLVETLKEFPADLVFVQGDTTTAFIGALAAYYRKTQVAHVEAGLRSGNKFSPFPEEMNRILAGHLSDFHFTPTDGAVENLRRENIHQNVYNVGNPVIDALMLGLELIRGEGEEKYAAHFSWLSSGKRIVLITGHRRESFGRPFENICEAIRESAGRFPDVQFVYPVHLNPNVREPVMRLLSDVPNVHLTEPLDYPHFIWLLSKSYLVLTDSGGLQEEAPALGKPVLVMRDVTERTEGIEAGTARLVGTEKEVIVDALTELLSDDVIYENMSKSSNPYGDGRSAGRIVEVIRKQILALSEA